MRTCIYATRLSDNGVQIDIGAVVRRQPSIKGWRGFAASFTDLIRFQRPFDDIRDRPLLSASEAMGEVTGFAAANRKLRFAH
jgi:hypothetical protein